MRKRLTLGMCMLLLVACAPSQDSMETAVAQTQLALPTATLTMVPTVTIEPSATPQPTVVPLADLPIESLLIANGDLPPDVEGGQVQTGWPKQLAYIVLPDAVWTQSFTVDGLATDGVTVALYESADTLDHAYDLIVRHMETMPEVKEDLDTVGEKAHFTTKKTYPNFVSLVYSRCRALVYIQMFPADKTTIVTYGQRLEKRLTDVVCN